MNLDIQSPTRRDTLRQALQYLVWTLTGEIDRSQPRAAHQAGLYITEARAILAEIKAAESQPPEA